MENIDFANWGPWIFLGLSVFAGAWILRLLTTRSGARSLFSSIKSVYQGDHDYASVDPRNFSWMSLDHYNRLTPALEERGFVYLEDLEDLTLTRAFPLTRTFVRCFSGAEGTIVAGVYDLKPRGWYRLLQMGGVLPKDLRTIDLETELTDGRFILSTTADRKMASSDIPPEAEAEYYPRGMPLDEFLSDHTARVQAALDAHPGLDLVRVRTSSECRAMQTRLQRLKNKFKQGRGYLTGEDIARASHDPDAPEVKKLADAVEKEKRSRGE